MEFSEQDKTKTVILTFTLVILMVVCYVRKRTKQQKCLPPGPTPYPIVGNAFQVGRLPHLTFTKWAETYGPVVYLQMGSEDWVVLNDGELIREMFAKNVATGRANDNAVFAESGPGYGIVLSEGELWESQRRFTLKTLRNLGFAKTALEGCIMEDVDITMNWLKERKNLSISGLRLFNAPVSNTLWNIISGQKCDWTRCTNKFLELGGELIDSLTEISSNGLLFAPFLRHVIPEAMGFTKWASTIDSLKKLCDTCIEEHLIENNNELRDFIDHYLQKIQSTTDSKSSFYQEEGRKNLMTTIFDLHLAGQETTSTTLSWALLYMSRHTTIQAKVQEEIENAIGLSETPCLFHRKRMPYVEAVLCEILRMGSPLPIGVPHRLLKDMEFHGYKLRKGMVVVSNLYGVHYNSKTWGDPEVFRPERFLNEDGTQIIKHSAFMPFADGKRRCLGETLARDSLFLYFTSIFQQFNVTPGKDPEKLVKDAAGLILAPKPFNVVFSPRDVTM